MRLMPDHDMSFGCDLVLEKRVPEYRPGYAMCVRVFHDEDDGEQGQIVIAGGEQMTLIASFAFSFAFGGLVMCGLKVVDPAAWACFLPVFASVRGLSADQQGYGQAVRQLEAMAKALFPRLPELTTTARAWQVAPSDC
jgi:hypothetical protein